MDKESLIILLVIPQNNFCEQQLRDLKTVFDAKLVRSVILSKSGLEAVGEMRTRLMPDGILVDWDKRFLPNKKFDAVVVVGGKGAKKLIGTKDFSTFRASSCNAKSPIKTIKTIKIKSFKDRIEIQFKSQSFLQQQVRSMVGCLKYLAEKKWTLKKFERVVRLKKRTLCAPPAPAHGLFLKKVIY